MRCLARGGSEGSWREIAGQSREQRRAAHTMIAPAPALAAALLCALAARLVGASLHCAMRREISPCTCRREDTNTGTINVLCQRINSYEEIAKAVTNKFNPKTKISLDISYSQLPDISAHTFRELGLSITKLKLNFDNLSELEEGVFSKLELVDFFSVADNSLAELPRHVLRNLPRVKTVDICRNKITALTQQDFQDVPTLEHLIIASNQISSIERHAFPKVLKHIHLAYNNLSSLFGSLRDLEKLEWIFINNNHLTHLDNELPVNAPRLIHIHAAQNQLQRLPQELRQLPALQTLYFYNNEIKSLDRTMQKLRKLVQLSLSFNKIESLAEDEFSEANALEKLYLDYNEISSLNGSLRNLRLLKYLNLSHNELTEFSLQEIKGLKILSMIDLSFNKIAHLTGNMENLVDADTKVLEIRLDHNYLHHIGGAMMGLHGLLRLNLSHNQIQEIAPDDLIGLDNLQLLDISHNQLITLDETSKTSLPALEELLAHHNNLTFLDKDFHALPSLCTADLSYNRIRSINYDLVSKTRCTVNGVPNLLKIYLQDNPVLCDEGIYDLVAEFDNFNARISGKSTCVAPATGAPPLRAMNDVVAPVIVMSHLSPPAEERVLPSLTYRRVGALIGHVLAEPEGGMPVLVEPPVTLPAAPAPGVVVKWPDDHRTPSEHSHLLALDAAH